MGKCARRNHLRHPLTGGRRRWRPPRSGAQCRKHRPRFRGRSIRATIAAMSVVAARSTLAKPDVPDLLARARTIAELARERAQQTETDRRVGEDMIARMREMDLFRIMQPQAYGGFECGFDVFSQVVATIATGCGSTGWVYGLLASHQWLIACFPREAQDEVWQDRERTRRRHLCAGRTGRRSGRRLPAVRDRQLLQRLRQCAVAAARRHDPAAGWRGEAGIFPAAQRRLHHRRQLAHDGACRHRQQEPRCPRRLRPRSSHAHLRRACRCQRAGHADASQSALPAIVPCRAADHDRVAGAGHGGRARWPISSPWPACAPRAVRWPAAIAAWPSSRRCRCASPRRAL